MDVLAFLVQTGASSIHVKTLLGKDEVHFVTGDVLFPTWYIPSLVSLKEFEEIKAKLTPLHSN